VTTPHGQGLGLRVLWD